MSVSAQVLTSFFSFNAFFLVTHDRLHQKTGLICIKDLSCPLHFMFCLHEQTSKLSVHIWQITRQLWVWLHVPNSHRTKTLGNFRIEFRNLFGRMCGSRIKKTCLSRKKKKKKTNNFSTNDLDLFRFFHFYLLIFGIESFTLFENAEELWQNKGLRRIVVVTAVVFFPSLGNGKLFYKKPFLKNGLYDIWRTKLTRQMTRAVVRIIEDNLTYLQKKNGKNIEKQKHEISPK